MELGHLTADFHIAVSFSPGTNDHQVRYLLAGEDLIARRWNDMLGLDPDEILTSPCPLLPGVAAGPVPIARCSCGFSGCGSEEVRIQAAGDMVVWLSQAGARLLAVPADTYGREVGRAMSDFSWETPDRSAARLFKARFGPQELSAFGFTLSWASGRVRRGWFTAAFDLHEAGHYQVLVHVPWRRAGLLRQPVAPAVIADDLVAELRRPPQEWRMAAWSPMELSLRAPSCAGPGWRRITKSLTKRWS